MSPFFTLVNKSSYELEVGEITNQGSTKWHYISSTEVRISSPELYTESDFAGSELVVAEVTPVSIVTAAEAYGYCFF